MSKNLIKLLLSNENFIKSLLIDFILSENPTTTIGNEVQFGVGGKFSDILCLFNKKIIAYEIKAYGDDFRNLKTQLNAYKRVFDYVFLIITEKHVEVAKNMLPTNVGLILVNSSAEIKIQRAPNLIKSNRKEDILFSMNKDFLVKYFNRSKYMRVDEIRFCLMNKSLRDLKGAHYKFLYKKLYPKNIIFHSETGLHTHFEDVSLLSFNEKSELL